MGTEKKFDVYGIGNAIMDLQLNVEDKDLVDFDLSKGRMRLTDGKTQAQLLKHFSRRGISKSSGGSAANTMIAIASLGGKVSYGCLVGDDSFGQAYYEEMAKLGIYLPNNPITGKQTGSCIVLITPDAERTLNTNLGVSALFAAEHVGADCVREANWLYIEGYLLSAKPGVEAAQTAVKLAKEHGASIAINFSDVSIVISHNTSLREIAEQSDLLIANFDEARAFVGAEDEDKVFTQLKKSAPNVVMTLGERGARAFFSGQEIVERAPKVRAVDSTGAGDMFAGGFLYGITHDLSPQQSCRLACSLASQVVSQLGPRLAPNLVKAALS